MKDTKHQDDLLIGPQAALQQYLDDLLQDATNTEVQDDLHEPASEQDTVETELTEAESADEAEREQLTSPLAEEETQTESLASPEFEAPLDDGQTAETQQELEAQPEQESAPDMAVVETPVEELVEPQVSTGELSEIESTQEVVHQEAQEPSAQPEAKIAKTEPLPWAKSRFECLLFYVGGLKMAVPLVELGGIHQGDKDKLAAIFGQPDWFMGVLKLPNNNIRTVDTARWVMPDHYQGELKDHFQFVIQLDRTDWGIACEKVAEAISLEPSQVKWRTDRSKRPWLAGTVIEHMCAILDIQGFIELLEDPGNGFKALTKQ